MNFKYFLNETETTVQPKTKDELKKIIEDTIKEQGLNCDLNFIDTSKITDMSYLFYNVKFNLTSTETFQNGMFQMLEI